MTADDQPTARDARREVGASLDPRWVDAMRRHGGTPADDATWQAIVDRAEDGSRPLAPASGRRKGATAWWAVAAALVAVVVGAAAVIATRDADDAEQVQAGPTEATWAEPAAEWERLPDPPLSPRDGVMTAWTGEELLVFGGTTWACPPGAGCEGPEPDQVVTDGAALDPATGEWRPIAPIPNGGLGGSVAVIDGEVYVLRPPALSERGTAWGDQTLLTYSVADDSWGEVTLPPEVGDGWYALEPAGDRLALYSGSDEVGVHPLMVFDPASERWTELPVAPLPTLYDREAVWSAPHLYVFGKELVANPGSEEPSLVIGARVDLASGEWERLPDSEVLGAPLVAADGLLVSPRRGEADGGDVNGWGRSYPEGGIFDAATEAWRDLPDPASAEGAGLIAGVLGSSSAWFSTPAGTVFDATTQRWITMPALRTSVADAGSDVDPHQVHAAGTDAVAIGGVAWSDDGEPRFLGDAWIWRSGRSSGAPAAVDPAADDPSTDSSDTMPPAAPDDDTRYFVATTVLDDGEGPELCLGGVADSLPPQCEGPPIEGWDWEDVDGEESAAGTTWGEFEVIGTYDGTTFTLTEAPAPVDESDDPELLDPWPALDHDLTPPCPEPEGGWQAEEPAAWNDEEIEAFVMDVRALPGFAGVWRDDLDGPADDSRRFVFTVAIAGGPDAETAAEQAIRGLWGGPVCVTGAERSLRDLEEVLAEARGIVEDVGATALSASIDEVGNAAHVQVMAPSPDLQAALDERLGDGTVIVFSALRRLA